LKYTHGIIATTEEDRNEAERAGGDGDDSGGERIERAKAHAEDCQGKGRRGKGSGNKQEHDQERFHFRRPLEFLCG
jgi:hypothetical protein